MAAYWLVLRLREALVRTELSTTQSQQLKLRLLKIGGQVIQTAWQGIFVLAHRQLQSDSC